MPELLSQPSGVSFPKWWGKAIGCWGNGDPARMLRRMQYGGNSPVTFTAAGNSFAVGVAFRPTCAITVNKIRFYGAGDTSVLRTAIYRYSDKARLAGPFNTATNINTWGSTGSAMALDLKAGELYFIACASVDAGVGANFAAIGAAPGATTGQIAVAPQSWPGNLDADSNFISGFAFTFAVTGGALPDPAPTLGNQSTAIGGIPAFFLDNSNA